MRSLASALGTGPMTLYNYVQDREGIEELCRRGNRLRSVSSAAPETAAGCRRHRDGDVARVACPSHRGPPGTHSTIRLTRELRTRGRTDRSTRRAGLDQYDLLAAFALCSVSLMGSAQAEHAGPLAGCGRDAQHRQPPNESGLMAGDEYPHIAALSQFAEHSRPRPISSVASICSSAASATGRRQSIRAINRLA